MSFFPHGSLGGIPCAERLGGRTRREWGEPHDLLPPLAGESIICLLALLMKAPADRHEWLVQHQSLALTFRTYSLPLLYPPRRLNGPAKPLLIAARLPYCNDALQIPAATSPR